MAPQGPLRQRSRGKGLTVGKLVVNAITENSYRGAVERKFKRLSELGVVTNMCDSHYHHDDTVQRPSDIYVTAPFRLL